MSSSAKRALRILEFVAGAEQPPGVVGIARALSLSPATVFRSIDALNRADLVARHRSSSRYVLGAAADRLCRTLIARFRIRELAQPYLRQLASLSGESASLHVRVGWYSVRIASALGAAEVTNAPPLGDANALAESCAGRAMLAFLGDAEAARYRTWAAKHDCKRSDEITLRAIRKQGLALDESASADGRMAVGFPIKGGGVVVAAMTIDGPVLEPPPYANNHAVWDWREIVSHFEYIGHSQPLLFENPFAHLDPDMIVL
jgi:DNA-binding IclR family transcriptional regulator